MERADKQQRVVIALGILLACCAYVFGLDPSLDIKQYAHTAWKAREDFSRGIIFSIAQTPDGYLWLGTEFGLFRFDGVRSVPWQPPAGQHLPSSEIRALLVARDGNLWIGTLKGLASWKDGKLTQYGELAGKVVLTLLEDREGTIWAGGWATSTGKVCAIQSRSAKCYGEEGSLGQGVYSIYEDSRGNLWLGAVTGLWRWKPGTPKRYPMPDPTPGINSLIEGDKGALLIATRNGIRRLAEGKSEEYPLPRVGRQFRPYRLLQDRNGGLWIGTDRGLLHVHQAGTELFTRSDGLSGDFVENFFEDREGNIWVATGNGLDRFRDFAVPTISANQGLSTDNVGSVVAARDGSVWLGSDDGLNRWNNGRITIYRKRSAPAVSVSAKREQKLASASESSVLGAVREITRSGLPDKGVESLTQDNRGRIWVFTSRGVVYFENGRFILASAVSGRQVFSSTGDSAGNLWISDQDKGLFHLLEGNVVERIPWVRLGGKDVATALVPDPMQGGLWLGFHDGGVAYFKDGQVRASYAGADGLGVGRVSHLRFGLRGALWAATEGGLSRIKDGRVVTLTSKNGLRCDTVLWSMEDDDHAVWVYTACGLVRIARSELDAWVRDPSRTVQSTVFDGSDGVRSHSFISGTTPHVAKSADGRLWFLPLDGVSVVDPHHLAFNKLPPPVHIEQIAADHKTYSATPNSNGQVSLPARVRDLQIDYTALSLVAPEKVLFRYKLEGWDRDWQDAGTRRQAFYNNLPPRNYTFRVKASNNSGVWNEAGTSLNFSIAPAYYQTNWFRLACVAAFLALLWGLHQLRLRRLARDFNMRLDERVSERTRIARDLHDTLLQNVQGLILKFHAIGRRIPTSDPTRQEIEKTLDYADQVLAEGRDRVRSLRAATIAFGGLPKAFRQVVEEAAPNRSSTFKAIVEGTVLELHPIIREETYSIGREALINALTHSEAQNIEAEITYDLREFRLRIRDDGRGIDPVVLEKGGRDDHWGLPGMRERAKRIGGKLDLWSRPGSGTEVELTVPAATAYRSSRGKPTDSPSGVSAAR